MTAPTADPAACAEAHLRIYRETGSRMALAMTFRYLLVESGRRRIAAPDAHYAAEWAAAERGV